MEGTENGKAGLKPAEAVGGTAVQRENGPYDRMVDEAFNHLLATYMASAHRKKTEIITTAFNFARRAHAGVTRKSGEPYIMHPLAVAQIAAEEMGLGSTSICSALLHDVVEDTEYTVEDISNVFGEKIANIVDGLTKISGGKFGKEESGQVENLRRLLLTMNEDLRVVLIKICDRLHNMRTLQAQPPAKQYKIAGETSMLYAPIASTLGFGKIKSELENLSFKYEHPDTYERISNLVAYSKKGRDELFEKFTGPILRKLDEYGYAYRVKARVKSPYSIWSKMQRKNINYDDVYDILAVRIIFTPKEEGEDGGARECFAIYSLINSLYDSDDKRMRNWLHTPKGNGYRALHGTFMSKQGQWIEVQIRTEKMDEVAERGVAAHWKYKQQEEAGRDSNGLLAGTASWIENVRAVLDDPNQTPTETLDNLKCTMYSEEMFIFTPKGDRIVLPVGSSVLDVAFHIHTMFGTNCIGGKLNSGHLVPATHKLESGDMVEVLYGQSSMVDERWLGNVKTSKARDSIARTLRKKRRENEAEGQRTLEAWLAERDAKPSTGTLSALAGAHNFKTPGELYVAIGRGTVVLGDADEKVLDGGLPDAKPKAGQGKGFFGRVKGIVKKPFLGKKDSKGYTETVKRDLLLVGEGFNKKVPCIINEDSIDMYIRKDCCNPIPGEDILGYMDGDGHVELHKRSCEIASKLKASFGNRILDAKWDMHKKLFFNAAVRIKGIDNQGMLLKVADLVSVQLHINFRKIEISAEDGIFEGEMGIGVHDTGEVEDLMEKLKAIDGIEEVTRH